MAIILKIFEQQPYPSNLNREVFFKLRQGKAGSCLSIEPPYTGIDELILEAVDEKGVHLFDLLGVRGDGTIVRYAMQEDILKSYGFQINEVSGAVKDFTER